jgi:three-Cys-motif partner protein
MKDERKGSPGVGCIGSDGLPLRETGPWATDKYHYVGHYMHMFATGMKNLWKRRTYVDLFAGPGRCRVKRTGEELDGSPLLALGCNFTSWLFVEKDPAYARALRDRCSKVKPDGGWRVLQGDCNEVVEEIRESLDVGCLALMVVDPYGMTNLRFETVRRITHDRRVDLIVTFPEEMSVRRNLWQWVRSSHCPLDDFMGAGEWRGALQRFRGAALPRLERTLAAVYKQALQNIGYTYADTVDEIVTIRTPRNVPLYKLIFASKHGRGVDFWNKAVAITPAGERKLPFGPAA